MLGPHLELSKGGMANWARDMVPELSCTLDVTFLPTYAPGLIKKIFFFTHALFHVLLRIGRYDIIHANIAGPTSLIRKLILLSPFLMLRVPIVFHLHGGQLFDDPLKFRKFISFWLISKFSRDVIFLVLGDSFRRRLLDKVPRAIVCVVPNFAQSRVVWSAAPSPRFVFAGNLTEQKGVYDIASAIIELPLDREWRLDFFGVGPGEELATTSLSQYVAMGRIAFHGWAQRERVQRVLADGGVLVLPSHWEGLPMIVLEAQAVGAPVISSNVGAIAEYVNSECGYLIAPGDVDALARAMNDVVQNPAQLPHLSSAIDSGKILTKGRVAKQLGEIYRNASELIALNNLN